MAENKTNTELDSLAFEIFKQSVASSPGNRGGEQQALASYKKAEAFIAVRDRVRSGEAKPVKADVLADCSAPNLKPTHPFNLVSQRFGSLEKVNRIAQFLDKHPTPAGEPDELVGSINRAFPELSWDIPMINTARAIFPAYCKN